MPGNNGHIHAHETHSDQCKRHLLQVAKMQQELEVQSAHIQRLQAARLAAEMELLHAHEEVESLHAALRSGQKCHNVVI